MSGEFGFLTRVWLCDLCQQPLEEGGRCNSGIHEGPDDPPNSFNGRAVEYVKADCEWTEMVDHWRGRTEHWIHRASRLEEALEAIQPVLIGVRTGALGIEALFDVTERIELALSREEA